MSDTDWRDAKNDPPKEWGAYLIWRGYFDVAIFYPDASDDWSAWQAMGHKIGGEVLKWTQLPAMP